MITSALTGGISSALFVPIMSGSMTGKTDQQETHLALLALTFNGIGCLLGAAINGKLMDKLGLKKVCLINILEISMAFAIVVWYNQVYEFHMWSASLMLFMWGVQSSGMEIFLQSVCGF